MYLLITKDLLLVVCRFESDFFRKLDAIRLTLIEFDMSIKIEISEILLVEKKDR